ncbi:TPA: DUF3885 domain-containing protein [Staphylococcus aureus]|uniref:DUF3885 domain-containing protein n=1 Tax=Staphylococcus aureus TaxID=1280 RepID=UPI000CD04B68|nr:DUF3885 domain-containing protein [Staphylococcus aureus]MCS4780354.1 DUF3885 domain-containing protein [Staphylococcus aureus]MCS4848390.1 DUF3885 domain-containing protein [Staphylococcus aureus]HBM8001111.1 DUF3885 domain-containing protein [Staphylococcus aureus]HBN6331882.1 DUF3885 domain-containing protein [Staphylococcus aureus]HDA1103853.1 DUF3885 domain-containing protein [Staphylococcus aureus]
MCFDINNLNIKKLNFRKVKNAIHLSLSGDKYQFLEDGKTINNTYFLAVYDNAINIFEDLFSPSDSINLVYVVYVYNEPYKKTNVIRKFTSLTIDELYYFKEYKKEKDDNILCEEFSYKCSIKDIKYKKLLKAISNQDFKGLVPNINQNDNYSEIYIINNTKNVIYHLYDDRGLWLAFNNNEDYARYSEKYNDLISEFDNEDI